ncbi:putative gustatory receptor 59e [Anopheles ziemanni]|uniref:putative gustatory receptor 59e n=1 Tax=Anopheles coustani TaxID=139045 RepID=UPI002659CC61|nr:putative gustatory receptor 59e [Anopheles coustani]XP_058178099.1 putative gustatory receptor 59e [Anopheles ziemanni]
MVLELLSNKQLFKNDFLRSARKVVRICQLFGTVPWYLDLFEAGFFLREQHQGGLRCWRLWCMQGLNTVYSIMITSAIMTTTVLQHSDFDWKMPFMTQMLYISEYITANGVVLMVLIGCHYQRCFYRKFAEKLLAITASIASCGAAVDFQRIENIFNRLLLGVALFFGTVLTVDFLYNDRSFWSFLRSSSVYTLSNIINVLGLIQYTYLLYFIYLFYSDVNRLLMSYTVNASRDKQCRTRRRLSYETTIVTPSSGGASLLYDYAHLIDLLRSIHLELNELLEQVNDCFGVLIVSTTTASFIVLSLQFFAIYTLTTVRVWKVSDTLLLVYTVLWIVLHGAKVLMVLYPSHLVQKERERTGPILYHFNPHEKDTALANALMKFSNQLLHETGHQTACGLIHLEMTLISTMVGALTTYLVILIQFDTAVSQGQSTANASQKGSSGA